MRFRLERWCGNCRGGEWLVIIMQRVCSLSHANTVATVGSLWVDGPRCVNGCLVLLLQHVSDQRREEKARNVEIAAVTRGDERAMQCNANLTPCDIFLALASGHFHIFPFISPPLFRPHCFHIAQRNSVYVDGLKLINLPLKSSVINTFQGMTAPNVHLYVLQYVAHINNSLMRVTQLFVMSGCVRVCVDVLVRNVRLTKQDATHSEVYKNVFVKTHPACT